VSRWWALPGGKHEGAARLVRPLSFKDGTVSLIDRMVEDGKPEIRLSTPVESRRGLAATTSS
jgi:hypothetical protein